MLKRIILGICLLGSACICFAGNYSDPSKPIVITKQKPEFTIILSSNRTTGFSWFLMPFPQEYFEIKKHRYERDEKAKIGEGGHEYWQIKAKPAAFDAPMMLTIGFVYLRSWELKDAQPVEFPVLTSD